MDALRLGRQFRALRIRRRLRQSDVAPLARLSRTKVSRIERGQILNMTLGDLDRAAAALGASLNVSIRWRGKLLDRLMDEGHARLVELVVGMLRATGWEVAVEVSYSIWGERGSIDVLAFHRLAGIVLVIEVKSVVPDSQAMLPALDRKTRLAAQIAKDRGWECRHVARMLVCRLVVDRPPTCGAAGVDLRNCVPRSRGQAATLAATTCRLRIGAAVPLIRARNAHQRCTRRPRAGP